MEPTRTGMAGGSPPKTSFGTGTLEVGCKYNYVDGPRS